MAQPAHSDSESNDAHLVNELVDLHADDPEFGYRFLYDELVAGGHDAGENRVHRLCWQNHRIADAAWQSIDYTCDGEGPHRRMRLHLRPRNQARDASTVRSPERLTGKAQQKLWPDWNHHALLTDLTGDVVDVDPFHREHATVELAIKDQKAGAGLEHLPSDVCSANLAWFQIAILAHNICRWTACLGGHDTDRLIVARAIRTCLLALPNRLVKRASQPTLRLPSRWPLAHTFTTILDALRALEPVPT